jgi:Subtilase family
MRGAIRAASYRPTFWEKQTLENTKPSRIKYLTKSAPYKFCTKIRKVRRFGEKRPERENFGSPLRPRSPEVTSAAAPHAAAIAALIIAYQPAITLAQLRAILTKTSLDIEVDGWDSASGYGIVMPGPALAAAATVVQGDLRR